MFASANYLTLPLLASIALLIDYAMGEPKKFHPLVGFGWLATQIEKYFNLPKWQARPLHRLTGLVGLLVLICPLVWLAYWLCQKTMFYTLINIYLLYFAIGHKSLHDHARAVLNALNANDLNQAKIAASYMVSRDSAAIDPIPATVESVLENGNDGVFGALFWFFIAGGVGALAFRLVNTMDAMWGYKTPRYYYFGWAAARLDDVIGYVPARLCALSYALLGNTKTALNCWKTQASTWDSPNAGPVMSTGAGALHLKLGGAACYQGEWHQRPVLGAGEPPVINDIERALALVRHSVYLWLAVFLIICVIKQIVAYA